MFLNKTRIASAKVSSSIQFIFGGLLMFFSVVGIIGVIMGDKSDKAQSSPDAGAIGVGLFILLLSALLFLLGLIKKMNITKAKKLSNIFFDSAIGSIVSIVLSSL